MRMRLNAIIVATGIVATGAVSYASVPKYVDALISNVSEKTDRLSVPTNHGTSYVTIKTRTEGMTIVSRVRVDGGFFERAAGLEAAASDHQQIAMRQAD